LTRPVELKGRADEEIALTTNSTTYHLRRAETSNLLLILSEPTEHEMDTEKETSIAYQYKFKSSVLSTTSLIIDSGSTFYEVIQGRPRFDQLSSLLVSYKGPNENAQNVTLINAGTNLYISANP
jgi:hypothetical protein